MSEVERLHLERDLYRRLLELGECEDVTPFLRDALTLVVEVARAHCGYLELHGEVHVARGLTDEEQADVRRRISSGIIGEALATGKTINTASAVEDPRFRDQRSVQAQRIRAVLCAPVGAPATGVLYLQGRDAPGPFTDDDRAHVELFARYVAPIADRLLCRSEDRGAQDHTKELRQKLAVSSIAGTSTALAAAFREILVAAPVDVAVLVRGDTGTGKTAMARALHDASPRARGPFVEVNCAAIPETLFESELFGAEKGAHSTATRRIDGKIDAARRGTLFLDEVGEMPLSVQAKLLTFLQSRRYYRLGGATAIDADVRVVAATNADLFALVAERRFREDLYYRLDVLTVNVPPLRDRRGDIGPIAQAILERLGEAHGKSLALARGARVALEEAEWPGNVRQLENVLQRGYAIALAEGALAMEARHVFPAARTAHEPVAEPVSYQDAMRSFQARFLREALEANDFNVSETARRIGLARSHLNDLVRVHGLARSRRSGAQ
jgi:transcriptional regulator with GAF, ATPase, and Fis domain